MNPLPNLEPTWNMAPTKNAPVVRLSRDGERHLDALKWGPVVPSFTKDLKKARKPIDARSETVATSGMFREAFADADAWSRPRSATNGGMTRRARRQFAVARNGRRCPVAFGSIWEAWKSPEGEWLQTFATITTEANQLLARNTGPQAGMAASVASRKDCRCCRFRAGGPPWRLRTCPDDIAV